MKNWFLYVPAIMFAPVVVASVAAAGAVIVTDNILGGPISRAGARWVNQQERENFKESDLYD